MLFNFIPKTLVQLLLQINALCVKQKFKPESYFLLFSLCHLVCDSLKLLGNWCCIVQLMYNIYVMTFACY